ncbi:centromere protein N [Betta splendens]|uniref:Centromere protein N n=1 Tax=Betta splendens TaxID=158456 RepID=A0A6P7M101_BETSP|nr:centromere protein N [Betta splendens]
MDDFGRRLLQRLVRRTPAQALKATLGKWERLTVAQRQSVDFTQPKVAVMEQLVAIFEENGWTVKHITELEMINYMENANRGMWHAFQMTDPKDDANAVEMMQFKEQFKSHLSELVRHVSVKIKKHTDEALWIRIAWGDSYSPPNHLKPTYVVHHLQTPYVFVTSLNSKQKPFLVQALILSTGYQGIKDANLSGQKLTAIRDLLMKQYQQIFPSKYNSPLTEKNETVSNPHIEREQSEHASKRLQMACEAFGDGIVPQLQTAVYKLETKFRGDANTNRTMTKREGPFRCLVKFASTNLLESFRECASSGIASTPVSPLLSSITLKGRNYFVVTENGLPSSQT